VPASGAHLSADARSRDEQGEALSALGAATLHAAAAVLANNLMIIGELLTKRVSRRCKANR